MEHTHTESEDTRAVLGRYLRRKLKLPLQIAGGGVALAALMGAVLPHHKKGPDFSNTVPMKETATAGTVQSIYSKSVGAPFTGTLLALSVQPGQEVHKGQPVFRMDTRGIAEELAQARAARANALAEYRQARAGMAADERELQSSIAAIQGQMRAARQAQTQAAAQAQAAAQQTAQGDGMDDGTAQVPAPAPTVTYDPSQEQALQVQLSALNAQLAERRRAWQPTLSAAGEQSAQAQRAVTRLEGMLKMAQRTSPADGVVTAVYAQAGASVTGNQPVLRVDNPAGYRVVAQIDDKGREALEPGVDLGLKLPSGASTGKVEKIVSGVDQQLFNYQVWVKPAPNVKVKPGDKIQVLVPQRADQTASIR